MNLSLKSTFMALSILGVSVFAQSVEHTHEEGIECTIRPLEPGGSGGAEVLPEIPVGTNVRGLQSLAGAPAVLLLSFDGGTYSVGGEDFTYQASTLSDQKIYALWRVVSEDYYPFNLNVTTDKSIFNATASDRRSHVIVTPALKKAGFAGWGWRTIEGDGFAEALDGGDHLYLGDLIAHEGGHTMGNAHSKFYDNGTLKDYYGGQGFWSPIMGGGPRHISQWDKGEFSNAYYSEDNFGNFGLSWKDDNYNYELYVDRLLFMGRNMEGINSGTPIYRTDDVGDDIASSVELMVEADGTLLGESNSSGIEFRADLDYYSFTLDTSSDLDIIISPDSIAANLNVEVKLWDNLGQLIETYSPVSEGTYNGVDFEANLSAQVQITLEAGTYYLSVDGVGEGDPKVDGFSDYGSLGQYAISGSIIANGMTSNLQQTPEMNSSLELNPSELLISWDSAESEIQIQVYNSQGEQIFSRSQLNMSQGIRSVQLNQVLVEGVYFVQISNLIESKTFRKVVVSH